MTQTNLQTRIAAVEEQQRAVQNTIQGRENAQRQAELDNRRLEQLNAERRALAVEQARQQFTVAIGTNETRLAAHNKLIAELHGALDTLDLRGALRIWPTLVQSFVDQQTFRQQAISVLADEFADAGIQEQQRQARSAYSDLQAVALAQSSAMMKRLSQLRNALEPYTVLAAYIDGKQGQERQIATGLTIAITGESFGPYFRVSAGYNAQAETDAIISKRMTQGYFHNRPLGS